MLTTSSSPALNFSSTFTNFTAGIFQFGSTIQKIHYPEGLQFQKSAVVLWVIGKLTLILTLSANSTRSQDHAPDPNQVKSKLIQSEAVVDIQNSVLIPIFHIQDVFVQSKDGRLQWQINTTVPSRHMLRKIAWVTDVINKYHLLVHSTDCNFIFSSHFYNAF